MRQPQEAKLGIKQDITAMRNNLIADVMVLREALPALTQEQREALASIETFCAVALRIIAKTNPSKVRSEVMTTQISYLMAPLPEAQHSSQHFEDRKGR